MVEGFVSLFAILLPHSPSPDILIIAIIAGMPVIKFGGSSLADAPRFRTVADIIINSIHNSKSPTVVVVSAMKEVTDILVNAAKAAETGNDTYLHHLSALKTKHHSAIKDLITDKIALENLLVTTDSLLTELGEILHGVELVRECSSRTSDLISGFGERLSSQILAAHITDRGIDATAVDAREIIRTDGSHGRAVVDFESTETLIRTRLAKVAYIPIVTGFIASTKDGIATTLGRNGSDYTASILAAALNSSSLEIWTDVDGILTADPRIIGNAWVIKEITFQEAMELSFFGAEVIHPYTLIPVVDKNLPVYIKNTLNPTAPGTRIAKETKTKKRPITGIASIDNVAMITIEGGGMVGMPGITSRILASVAAADISIIMITQSSSEHNISLVCRQEEAYIALDVLKKDFSDVIASRIIRDIKIKESLEIIAVIGENMRGKIGLCGQLFSAVGDAGINILAIAQGSTELNISLVIEGQDKVAAITAIHRTFIG